MKALRTSSIAILALLICSCTQHGFKVFSGYAQGGTYAVKVRMDGVKARPEAMADSIEAILHMIDTTFSGYNHNSILSRRNAGADIPVNADFKRLSRISEEFRIASDGAFDIASAPLYDIWGFGFTSDTLPSPERIALAMEECRRQKKINFNAIAQGYTCDRIAEYLRSVGAEDFLVDIGEIYCQGNGPSGEGWSIGIDTPEDGNDTPGAKLSGIWKSRSRACGVVTSGNYRKFYIRDGQKYAHTIDPRTGYPVQHNLLCATVIAPTATEADATATWLMVLGFEKAKEKILSSPDLEACLISADTTWFSPGF